MTDEDPVRWRPERRVRTSNAGNSRYQGPEVGKAQQKFRKFSGTAT